MRRRHFISGTAAAAFFPVKLCVKAPPIVRAAGEPARAILATFELISKNSGVLPFTLGLPLKKGAAFGDLATDGATSQVIVMRKWNDGSAKHVIISGTARLSAGVALSVRVVSGTRASGRNLTAEDIARAAPSASADLGSEGSANLSSLLTNPLRTFISGPEMVECHYKIKSAGGLLLLFYVRLWKNGQVWVRVGGENGWVDAPNSDKNYRAVVSVGDKQVFSSALHHFAHTRWTAAAWVGSDPGVALKHRSTELIATELVPNYFAARPDSATLNALNQDYKPFDHGAWTVDMGSGGFSNQIGLLPNWDALFITSDADSRAFEAVIANSEALNSYAIVWRGARDEDLPCRPSAYPTHTFIGANGNGGGPPSVGGLSWEGAHHGSAGYLAYMLTGDYFHLETMQHQAGNVYLQNASLYGAGTSRRFTSQTRAVAWAFRTVSQLAAIMPAESALSDYQALLEANVRYLLATANTPGMNHLGILYDYEIATQAYGRGYILAPWQHNFLIQVFGMGSDIEPLDDMSSWNDVRDNLYRWCVGILGSGAPGTFCYDYAGDYELVVGPTSDSRTLTGLYSDFGEVFRANHDSSPCTTKLQGKSGGDPANASSGYWGNLLPAIAYAVDHGAPGAAAAWRRLTAAANWSAVINSGFANTPLWGIRPRSLDKT